MSYPEVKDSECVNFLFKSKKKLAKTFRLLPHNIYSASPLKIPNVLRAVGDDRMVMLVELKV